MDLYLREVTENRSTRRKKPDNQPEKNRYLIIIRGENSPSQPGIEPSPSNIGDNFAQSERAGCSPLNYCLPPPSPFPLLGFWSPRPGSLWRQLNTTVLNKSNDFRKTQASLTRTRTRTINLFQKTYVGT